MKITTQIVNKQEVKMVDLPQPPVRTIRADQYLAGLKMQLASAQKIVDDLTPKVKELEDAGVVVAVNPMMGIKPLPVVEKIV